MDMKMSAERITSTEVPVWDLKVEGGIVPILTGDEEDIQIATLAGFLEVGTIPQLPNVGVPWGQFLTQDVTFGEIDMAVRQSIESAGKVGFYPQYDIDENTKRLSMTIGKEIA